MPTVFFTLNDIYELKNLPKLKTLLDVKRREYKGYNIIVTVNGDFLAPSLLSSLDLGMNMVEAFNYLGVTHVCLGNHEFDNAESIKVLEREANFKVINSNFEGLPWTIPYDIIGDVLIVGGCVPCVNFPPGKMDSVNDSILRIKHDMEGKFKYSVALTHQDYADDLKIKDDFDLILAGHDHELMIIHPIYKVGMDAEYMGIYCLEEGSFQIHRTENYEEDLGMVAFIKEQEKKISEISKLPLFYIDPETKDSYSFKKVRVKQSEGIKKFYEIINKLYDTDGYVFNSGMFRNEVDLTTISLNDVRKMFPNKSALHPVTIPKSMVVSLIEEGKGLIGDGMYVQYGFRKGYDFEKQEDDAMITILIGDYMTKPSKTYKSIADFVKTQKFEERPPFEYILFQMSRPEILRSLKDFYETQSQIDVFEMITGQKQLQFLFQYSQNQLQRQYPEGKQSKMWKQTYSPHSLYSQSYINDISTISHTEVGKQPLIQLPEPDSNEQNFFSHTSPASPTSPDTKCNANEDKIKKQTRVTLSSLSLEGSDDSVMNEDKESEDEEMKGGANGGKEKQD